MRSVEVGKIGREPVGQGRRGRSAVERFDQRLAVVVVPESDRGGVAARQRRPRLRLNGDCGGGGGVPLGGGLVRRRGRSRGCPPAGGGARTVMVAEEWLLC